MAGIGFDEWIAERYETLWPELFDPAVVDPAVSVLADLAAAGPALEFGVGTGRIALPLSGPAAFGYTVRSGWTMKARPSPCRRSRSRSRAATRWYV